MIYINFKAELRHGAVTDQCPLLEGTGVLTEEAHDR